jgi:subtilisin family serine protease
MLKIMLSGASVLTSLLSTPAAAANYPTGYSAAWFSQINLTDAIETQARGGAGFKIGLVDTGVVATNKEIAGRVSASSSCAAVTFTCRYGYTDDNGHGTATASIAAGSTKIGGLMSGVAPAATIIAEKVLNASGAGYDTDVANGIVKAANAGAQVISLSLTYIPSASVVNAINYAAAKGAVTVFAGGNSSAPLDGGGNTVGLTSAAQSRLIFVGSVSAADKISSFSNTPGTGGVVIGATRTSYASMWLVAPGENIVAPGIQFGAAAYAYWTGTSMATPMVAGAVALLETTWPVLGRNGSAAAVLFQTATDLGPAGTDAAYGVGLINLTKAFQPVGQLSVLTVQGQSVPVSRLSSANITSGALGALPAIKATLSNYTAFDSFQRNFGVDLSGLISKTPASSLSTANLIAAPVVVTTRHLAGGGSMTLASSVQPFADQVSAEDATTVQQAMQLAERTLGPRDPSAFLVSVTTADGSTFAAGKGLSSTNAFAGALWGVDSAAAFQSSQIGASSALMGLSQGGYFAAMGADISQDARVAFSWTASPSVQPWSGIPNQSFSQSQSNAVGIGLTTRLTGRWRAGVTVSALNETNSLLGVNYNAQSLLGFGAQHRSSAFGLSSSYDLGAGRSLLVDASFARIGGGAGATGLIGAVSALTARAYGAALLQDDVLRPGDHLSLSVRKPLRVMSGSAQIAVTGVDQDGYPVVSSNRVSLKPDGDETDFAMAYAAALRAGGDLSAGLDYRSDADNVRGLGDVAVRIAFSQRF